MRGLRAAPWLAAALVAVTAALGVWRAAQIAGADESRPWAGHRWHGAAGASPTSALPKQRAAVDPPGTYDLPIIMPAPAFALEDAASRRVVRLADFRGRPLLLSFTYTRCADPDACPLASRVLQQLQRKLDERRVTGPDAPMLASVTFDPERDDRDALLRYARAHGADPVRWRMLRPSGPAAARQLLAAYDHPVFPRPDGSIDHPLRVYLIDGEGRVRQIYSQAYLDPEVVLADLETVGRAPRPQD